VFPARTAPPCRPATDRKQFCCDVSVIMGSGVRSSVPRATIALHAEARNLCRSCETMSSTEKADGRDAVGFFLRLPARLSGSVAIPNLMLRADD
jgi:hypothetical protein